LGFVLQQWQRGNIENVAIESVEIKGYEMTPSSIQQEMYELVLVLNIL
jgi:hypothetical protein